jgi:hypothetical protein
MEGVRMHRRSFLMLAVLSALGLPLGRTPPAGPRIRRHGRLFVVDGWILTAEDLRALGLHAA